MKKRLLKLTVLLLLAAFTGFAQERTVTGTVTAKDGSAMPGVNVILKGTSSGTTTDANGVYSIKALSDQSVLVFSFIGSATQEVIVGSQTTLNVALEDDAQQLGEVVITALGVARETKTLVYATQSVKASSLTEVRDANNVINSLSGKIANAVIVQGSGGVGSGARIILRGNRSVQGTSNALIVVDGVPINNSTSSTAGNDFGSVQSSDGASDINPDDIETMDVLPGAAAAALYGGAAGNGVIVITTKKGYKDHTAVEVNTGYTFESPFSLPAVQNTYGQGSNGNIDVSTGDSWGAKMTGQTYTNHLGDERKYSAQPDNIKDFFRTGSSFNTHVGVRGGNEFVQTYIAYTNNKVQGIMPNNDLQRHNITLRLTSDLGKRFSVDAKTTYIHRDRLNVPRTGEENAPVIDIYQIPRSLSISDAKNSEKFDNVGTPVPTVWPSTLSSIYQNPYWLINRSVINDFRDRVMGHLILKYNITNWLSLQGRANLDKYTDVIGQSYSQGTLLWATNPGGAYAKTVGNTTQQWYDLTLSGSKKLTGDLGVDFMAGGIFFRQDNNADNSIANGLNITNKFNLNFATTPQFSSGSVSSESQSVFAKASVGYKDAMFVEASVRNDWDSRIKSPYSILYPSIGANAILSELISLPSMFSFLKVSANYARVGNGGQAQARAATYAYSQGSGNGFLQRSPTKPIENLKPELVTSLEFNLNAKIWQNRLGLSATYYNSNSTNQLLVLPLPPATGYSSQYINAGKIQNKGLEIVLTGTPVKTNNLTWDVAVNFGMNRNKVIKLDPNIKQTPLTGGSGFGRSATPVVQEGGRFGDLIGYKWKTDANGNYMVKADGTPMQSDKQEYLGNFNPKANLGLTNTLQYKSFSLRLLIDGRFGGIIVNGTEMNLAFSGITKGTEEHRIDKFNLGGVDSDGNAVNTDITAQQFWQTVSTKRYGTAQFFAYDATNVRVRELSLGYNLPIPKNLIIKSAKLSVVARNLFWLYRGSSILDIPVLGKRKMSFDPDMSLGNGNYQGIQYGTIPSTRSAGFNLQLVF
jgi:TonB-linked SusC/RagA family outer membrane protein